MINIAILGHGTVGSGVAEVLHKNSGSIARKAGEEINVKYILDLRDFPESPYAEKFTKNFADIAEDPEVKVVVEAMGGVTPACDFIREALNKGKSVVTSNKELVAERGAELLALAEKNNVNFLFEASVGGGIPIIRPLSQCLAANEIDEIAGILNGTTNFILTKMFKENMPFEEALELAKRLGYAEANPSADVDGHDACRKICILASLAFGSHIYPENVSTQGITGITPEDVAYAADAGCVIKLIAQTKRPDSSGKIFAMVSPALVSEESQLSGVDDVFNAILVRGDATGEVVFYGKGAGKLPTASAVIGDVIECVKAAGNIGSLNWQDTGRDNVADAKATEARFYIRLLGNEETVTCVGFVGKGVEKTGYRQLQRPGMPDNECAMITPKMSEANLDRILGEMKTKTLAKIRLLEDA